MTRLLMNSFFLIIGHSLFGQLVERVDVEMTPFNSTSPIFNPSLGLLTAPQFSHADIDLDGVLDLFIFDRRGNNVIVLASDGNGGYIHNPDLTGIFPDYLHSWVLLRDFDGDGLPDIFSAPRVAGIPGIEVHKGKEENGRLFFEPFVMKDSQFNVLEYPLGGNNITIYSAFSDLPAIEDVDGDGDFDVVSFEIGGSVARLYRNYAVEISGRQDTFIMELEDFCYGKFREDDFSAVLSLSDNPDVCAQALRGSGQIRHAGSSITLLDVSGNGSYDMLLGDLSSPNTIFLRNSQSGLEAWYTDLDLTYPSYSIPMTADIFSATFAIDVDQDGNLDVINAPNTRNSNPKEEGIWLYENISEDSVLLQLKTKSFIQENSLPFGGFTHAAPIDIDQDGDQDLLVGARGKEENGTIVASLHLLENTSDAGTLSFSIINPDYLNMSLLNTESGTYAPATGDIDGDGDIDLIVGDREGKLFFWENSAGINARPVFNNFVYEYAAIDVGQNAKPFIIDINDDGLDDLVIGERNDNRQGEILGGVNLFLNKGEPGNPVFDSDPEADGNTAVLGGIFTRDNNVSVGSSSPFIFKNSDDLNAFVGSESGQVKFYNNLKDNIYSISDLIEDNVLPFKIGGNTTVTGTDLDADNKLDLIIGTNTGSLYFFKTDFVFSTTNSNKEITQVEFQVYPNPVKDRINIRSAENILRWQLIDLQGKVVLNSTNTDLPINFPSGIYVVRVDFDKGSFSQKIIITD